MPIPRQGPEDPGCTRDSHPDKGRDKGSHLLGVMRGWGHRWGVAAGEAGSVVVTANLCGRNLPDDTPSAGVC